MTTSRTTYSDGEIVEREGLRFRINIEDDPDFGPPWDEGDGQGIISDWETRDKKPGERVLNTDRSSKRFYDIQATTAKAKQEGWGLAPERIAEWTAKAGRAPTKKQITAAAVEHNYKWMRGWCTDQWRYCGIIVTLLGEVGDGGMDDNVENDYGHAIWGMESEDDAGIAEYAEEFMDEIIREHTEELKETKRADELAAMEHAELVAVAQEVAEFICENMPERRSVAYTIQFMEQFDKLCKRAGVDLTETETKGE